MKATHLIRILILTTTYALSAAHADVSPEAQALADSVSAKLTSAKTIQLSAKHKLSPQLTIKGKLNKGPLQFTVKRPNQVFVSQPDGHESRELAYDGKTLCFMLPLLKLHAMESLPAKSIDELAEAMDKRFGFRPPVVELLSENFSSQLFSNVTSAKVTGTEWVGFTKCERLHFEQEGMSGDLWVGKKDKLPRRYLLTFTSLDGNPTWDIRLTKWQLNEAVDETLFSKRPASDSQKTSLLK